MTRRGSHVKSQWNTDVCHVTVSLSYSAWKQENEKEQEEIYLKMTGLRRLRHRVLSILQKETLLFILCTAVVFSFAVLNNHLVKKYQIMFYKIKCLHFALTFPMDGIKGSATHKNRLLMISYLTPIGSHTPVPVLGAKSVSCAQEDILNFPLIISSSGQLRSSPVSPYTLLFSELPLDAFIKNKKKVKGNYNRALWLTQCLTKKGPLKSFKVVCLLKRASNKWSKCYNYIWINVLFLHRCLFWPVVNGNNVGGSCWQTGTLLGGLGSVFITSQVERLIANARPLTRGNQNIVDTPTGRNRETAGEQCFLALL